MKMQLEDFAALLSGMTVIINECSIQVLVGVPTQSGEEEREDAVGHGMGFLAELEEPEEDEEYGGEEPEIEEVECRKSAVRATTKRRVSTSGEVAQADKKPRKSLKSKA